ncbi:matrixin family metalloprotease [Aquimarina litoralis]|uniref:matrixin family metalloprotease n=1 Tax=Aquimarina litoralis TaxID=584605 RepID=UPI001C58D0AC|nr:matrixin family metalloprotease [Aquimarina litoralis]MBW1296395.1 matrixin family metalloprotease [Aquimarina litoralis]
MKKHVCLLLLFIISSVIGYGQGCSALIEPVSLEQRIMEASVIVEGKVISSNSYWDSDRQNIYTVHQIESYKNFKGTSTSIVKVVTSGGQIGENIQITSSAANLSKGITGIFFLKDFRKDLKVSDNLLEMVGAVQGLVKYNKVSNEASDVFFKYTSIEDDLYYRVQKTTKRRYTQLKERPLRQQKRAALATPIIYSFSPLSATAGTGTVLTITGTNFGSSTGSVGFSNANDGGTTYTYALDSQILSWSNTEIQVEIPYLAGTGSITVIDTDNDSEVTTVPLTIAYSHLNATSGTVDYPSTLQDDNGSGGFTFEYHTDFDTSDAKTYFEDAFELWNCESGINFSFGSTTSTDESIADGINVVRFDNGSELSTGVLGQVTTRYLGSCGTTNRAIANEIDITWNDSTNWYYGSGDPSASQYDFKTVALHELGHAHQLGHVIDTDLIMHYNLGAGENRYSIGTDDVDAAVYTMSIFEQSPGCSVTAMSSSVFCCDDIAISSHPQDATVGENGSIQFSVTASGNDTTSWFSSADGNSWTMLSDDSVYSGTSTATLTLTNVPSSYNGLFYRAYLENACSEFLNTDQATLTVYEYTAIPDTNFESALEALGYDDVSGDGQVPTYLIETVTSLDVQYSSISDLTGIEDFTALEYLQVRNNSLTTLDVSANTALVSIACRDNGIATLDVSNSPNLISIYGAYNNLTEIDLSNNPLLEALAVRNNSLTTLDLTKNTALNEINVRNNSLTSLDLRNGANTNLTSHNFNGNSNLSCILVDDADYSTTNWTNVEATTSFSDNEYCRYTAVPDSNFEAVLETLGYDDISNDGQVPTALIENVTSLAIPENNIEDTTGIEDFVSLTTLEFYQSGVISLDLSNNTLLETISITDNPLTSINISGLINLRELVLVQTDITSIDVSSNTSLVVLDISDNPLLSSVDVRNGNNSNFTSFDATNTTSLTCIRVDDADYSNTNWSGNIDSDASFTETEYCIYTAIPDANFEAALNAQNYDDISGDGQVPTELIETITSLTVDNESITDLTGIEDFVALTTLNITENIFTTLDLSNNTNLTSLEANSCGLTSLDISQNNKLEELTAYSNELTTLDTSNNAALKSLTMYSNNITTLDLSSNTALELVEVYDNDLTQLNVQNGNNSQILTFDATGNSNLSCILVDDITYSTSNWTDIDGHTSFSDTQCEAYTTIPDSNFETALNSLGYDDIPGDNLIPTDSIASVTRLEVGNLDIADLTGIDDFTSLTYLDVRNNDLTELSLPNNSAIDTLYVQGNKLTSLDITNNPEIIKLDFNGNSLTSIDLSQNVNLEDVDGYKNSLTELDITNNTALREIYVFDNNLTSINTSNNIALETLYIYQNEISNLDVSNNTNLLALSCRSNNLTSLDLSNNSQLVYLAALSNAIETIDISNSISLETLFIYDNNLTALDVSNNVQLKYLLCQNNDITTSLDLSTHTLLEQLNISNNGITGLNLQNGNNTNISTLEISGNPDLYCVQVDDVDYANTNFTGKDAQTTFSTLCDGVSVSLTVVLEGAFDLGGSGSDILMHDDLRDNGVLPTTSPYEDAITVSASVFDVTGSTAVVDWVQVQLRNSEDISEILASKSALLLRNGTIVDYDGASEVGIDATEGDYYVAVAHRNHLTIGSSTVHSLSTNTTLTLDMTTDTNVLNAANALNDMGDGYYAMPSGDYDGNGQLQNSDVSAIINLLGGSGYSEADLDMNGQVQNTDINNLLNPNIGKGEQF